MLYIIMEYACGGDLSGAIKRHIAAGTHFPEEKLWSFLIQMTQGLQHLHSRRILHRDIKPQNVFLNVAQSGETEIKIGDLGLGKIMTASDRCAVSQVFVRMRPGWLAEFLTSAERQGRRRSLGCASLSGRSAHPCTFRRKSVKDARMTRKAMYGAWAA